MGFLNIFSKEKDDYQSLKKNYKILQDEFTKLKASNRELNDNLELMKKENQYYADYILQLRQGSHIEKSTQVEGSSEDIPEIILPTANPTPKLQGEPRYTNMGDGSLIIDKFPGKLDISREKITIL